MNTFEAITTRYACRAYTDKQLTQEQTEKLIQAANAAPAASHNFSMVKLTVVQNKDLISEIDSATAHGLPPLGDHPTFNAQTLMILSIKPNEQVPFVPYCNASCMAENIMIQANSLGLASCFLMGVPLVLQKKTDILKKLNINCGFIPVIIVTLGYAKNPQNITKPKRIEVEIF